ANIIKILDFGLAKALPDSFTGSASSTATTSPVTRTQAGVVLGTAPYMSPEQVQGKSVDKRSDIWAFGAVLYEMLTARRSFEGNTVSETNAAILYRDPDWSTLTEATPSGIRRLLRRCLEKDPQRRLHDIADAKLDIEEALGGETTIPATPNGRPTRLRTAVAITSILMVGI